MAVPAWTSTWWLVKLLISDAMSVSWMADCEADRFSTATPRLSIVDWKRFWMAPRLPRVDDTLAMAEASDVMAADALLTRSRELMPRPAVLTLAIDTLMVSPALEPTWNTAPVPAAAVE